MRDEAKRMMNLFSGLDGVHGTHGVPDREGLKWGIKRTARTLREPVTVELWMQHLQGTRPLGVVPIREDHTCNWGSIDVDQYDINLIELVDKVEQQKLPLVSCRSKSGGLHLFLFTREPQPAASIQGLLRDIAASMGLSGSEIFPKQTQLLTDRGDAGNWMVMPYFGGTFDGKLKEQVGLKRTGAEMVVEEFLDLAEASRLTSVEFEKLVNRRAQTGREPLPFEDGPRCLQHLAKDGFPEGGRNNALFMVGLYLKRKYPQDWRERLDVSNRNHMVPPLDSDEVQVCVRSLEKKEYEYTCKNEPMVSHCDAAVCRMRRFGVGEAGSYPVISGLSKLDIPEAPIWFVDIDESRVELTTEQLQSYYLFQRACMEKVNRTYRVIRQPDWIVVLAEAMANLTVIEAPPDTGAPEAFRELLEVFLTDRSRGQQKEDILAGRPWEDEEARRHYFRLADLVKFFQREGWREPKRGEVTVRLQKLGGGPEFFNIKGKGVNVWFVPSRVVEGTPSLGIPQVPREAI